MMAAILTAVPSAAHPLPDGDRELTGYHIFLTGREGMIVRLALQGAARRLSNPRCEQIFEDFKDPKGNALKTNLIAAGASSRIFLAKLYFVDGNDTVQCRTSESLGAFTEPGSRVVHICSKQFVKFAPQTEAGEVLLIHELLHTLGLSENPPTSEQITDAVANRCR
jgi:hypothetical protein